MHTTTTGRRFVLAQLGQQHIAIPIEEMEEITALPPLMRVPHGPAALMGLANLRGTVLPVVDARRVTDPEAPGGAAPAQVLVCRAPDRVGLAVDLVLGLASATAAEIDSAPPGGPGTAIRALLRLPGMDRPCPVPDLPLLLSRIRVPEAAARPLRKGIDAGTRGGPAETVAEDRRFLVLDLGGRAAALSVDRIDAVRVLDRAVTPLPGAPDWIVGAMLEPGGTMPLADLGQLAGQVAARAGMAPRMILALKAGGAGPARIGLLVDAVTEIVTVAEQAIRPPLAALGADPPGAVEALLHLDGGARVAPLLGLDRLLTAERIALLGAAGALPPTEPEPDMHDHAPQAAADADLQGVVFALGAEEYAVPIGAVREIIDMPAQLTRIPGARRCCLGVTNLRGAVLPIIDLRRRFGLAEAAGGGQREVLVLGTEGTATGFVVDRVLQVIRLPADSLHAATDTRRAGPVLPVRRIANLAAEQRMILVLDPAVLDPDVLDAGVDGGGAPAAAVGAGG